MIAHTSVDLADWPAVRTALAAAAVRDTVSVHDNHAAGKVCLESRSRADAATVLDLITNAIHEHHTQATAARRNLKKQLMIRRAQCRTEQSP